MMASVSVASAQTSELEGIPREALAPNQEAIDFFAIFEARARAGEPFPELPAELLTEMDAQLSRFYARGEQVPNWSTTGVDLYPVVAARDGGMSANMLSAPGPYGPTNSLLLDVPLDSVAPQGWALVATYGDVRGGEVVQTEYGHVSRKVMIVERVAYRRRANALCRARAETRVYSNPEVAASEADTVAFMIIHAMLPRLERDTVCHVMVEVEPGKYQDRSFDEQGYRLPLFDDDDDQPYTIVPRPTASEQSTSG